uniref:LTO1 maturation factor of ABCE1 n=1 Tax=Oncorhynchus kisutch TaxID=8019 RepID=A0A8C7M206_ONCKI
MAHKSEDRLNTALFHVEGYRKGFDEGTRQGMIDGMKHGASHGVSFYYGFGITWKWLLQNNTDVKARLKALESPLGLILKFPHEEPQYENLQEDMEKVRAKFRLVCSLLNVPTDFSDYVKSGGYPSEGNWQPSA